MVPGFQDPAIPSFDVAGSDGAVEPWHRGPIVLKVGIIELVTARFSVAKESQPATLVKFAVNVPAAFIVWPFQLYGSWFEHIVVLVVLVSVGLTVRLSVATESQPAALVRFAVNVPAAFIV